jgi:hypothetical protein
VHQEQENLKQSKISGGVERSDNIAWGYAASPSSAASRLYQEHSNSSQNRKSLAVWSAATKRTVGKFSLWA